MGIIKVEPTDFDTVREITINTINAVYPHYYPEGAVDFFLSHHNDDNIKNDIASDFVYLLSNEKGKAVGTVTIKSNEICRLFVLPEYQKMGFGRRLLDFAEEKIAETHDEIIIEASLPAKTIYIKRGYTETAYHTIETDNGDFLCYDEMKKIIEKQ